jgi:hypothetical protein
MGGVALPPSHPTGIGRTGQDERNEMVVKEGHRVGQHGRTDMSCSPWSAASGMESDWQMGTL